MKKDFLCVKKSRTVKPACLFVCLLSLNNLFAPYCILKIRDSTVLDSITDKKSFLVFRFGVCKGVLMGSEKLCRDAVAAEV